MKRAHGWVALPFLNIVFGLGFGAGCGAADLGPPLVATPSHASLFGDVDVVFSGDVASLGEITLVQVGGILAYHLRATATSVTVTLQGAPSPGPADLLVVGTRATAYRHRVFTFDPPLDRVPLKWAAFGASLTEGIQSTGLVPHTQLHAIAGDVARAAGVFLGVPLFVDWMILPLQPSDFMPDCTQKPGTGPNIATITNGITDPATGLFNLGLARIDPALPPRNFAVGGSKISDTLRGGRGNPGILEHVVEDIDDGDLLGPVTVSQIDRIEKLDPDVGLVSDLLANDLDVSVVQTDDLHPERITSLDVATPLLQEMMTRLGKLHGHYFIANIPSLTFVPNVALLRQKLVAAGMSTAAFDAKLSQIDALTDQYNAALLSALQPHANLHLVDFKGLVDALKSGLRVGGEWLTPARFDGLLSLDNLHFTDTGYALYANLFIDALNGVLRAAIPHVDVEATHAGDPLTPTRLRAAGLTCVPPPM